MDFGGVSSQVFEDMQPVYRIMNWTIFAVFVVSNLAVLMYLKFKIGYWGWFTFSMHFVAFSLRVLVAFLPSSFDTLYAINVSSQTLIWTSLYNFTFQILLINSQIYNQTSPERQKKILIYRISTISLMIFANTLYFILYVSSFNQYESYVDLAYIVIKLILDTTIEVIFLKVAISMIKFKKKQSNLSCSNIKVLVFVAFVFAIVLIQTWFYITILFAIFLQVKWKTFETFLFVRDILNFCVYPINDFLVAMGFTAIYYYQGKKEREQQGKQSEEVEADVINGTSINSDVEQMLTEEAKLLVAKEDDVDRTKNVSKFMNNILKLNDIRKGSVSKFVYDCLTK